MLYSDLNAFERETYMLETPETREEILLIFEAAEYMAESNWTNAIVKIRKFRELPTDNRPPNRGLERQAQLMESFCLYHLNNQEEAQEILVQLLDEFEQPEERSIQSQNSSHSSIKGQRFKSQNSLAVRAYTFAATIIINSEDTGLDYKDIRDRLLNILKPKQMNIYLPEVLGTLTGCKYFQPLIALKDLPGIHSPVLARKLQLIADWKFIAGLPEQALQFKRRAQNLWELLNCRSQFMECQSQLKDLQTKKKSPYLMKLSRIKVFADALLKIEPPLVFNNKQTLLKWKIPTIIDEILPAPSEVKPKKQSGFGQSKPQKDDQKKSLLKDIVAMSNRFYKLYKQEINSQSTNLIHNSKFLEEQILIIRKKMLVLVRIRTKRLRDSWKRIQLVSFPDKPVLNSGVLKEKHSVYF